MPDPRARRLTGSDARKLSAASGAVKCPRTAKFPLGATIFVSGRLLRQWPVCGEQPFASVRFPRRCTSVSPRRRARRDASRLRAAAGAGRARRRGRARARDGRAPRRRGRHRHRQEPRLPDPGARVRAARRRRDRDEGAPGAAARERRARRRRARSGARCGSPCSRAAQNYLCRKQLQSFGPMLLRDPRDEAGLRGARSRGSPRPRPATAPSSRSSRRRRSGPSSPSAPTAAPAGAARFSRSCFAEAARGARRRGRARDREPRALLRRPRRRRRRPARARRRRLRRGAPARGDGRDLARRARLARRAAPARRRRRARLPRGGRDAAPGRALDRVERAGERLLRAVAPPAGRRRLRELPVERAARRSSTRSPRSPTSCTAAARSSTSSRAARSRRRRRSRRASSPAALERVVWAEPDAVAWAPVDVSGELRERLWDDGPTAILVSATLTTGEDAALRPPPARARPRARARRRLAVRLPRAGAALRAADDARPAQRRLHRARGRRGARAARALARAARSCSPRATARSTCCASACRGRVPYEVLVQGDAPRERLLERFRDEVDSVLLATVDLLAGRRRARASRSRCS